ncbi:Global transcription factor group E4 putative isoform 5 [Tripterygium wilfordii]|uniref:Global transcription factor group E4 putative isoform 5 n=1 Tax=Tripterygium wilfordii TaxID=458696 RepID=A0A7J7C294_TRIWF|nr:transcription factor GTE3, chloroplastic-like isoform X2 [Tripterygium wilfordii]KAF5728274.1 Global transcription factor group E4 putative isoform 5 [Tripterygium wilfordii]
MAKGSLGGAGEDDSPVKKRKRVDTGKKPNNSSQQRVATHDSSGRNHLLSGPPSSGDRNAVSGYVKFENKVTINFSSKSKSEIRELKSKLVSELDQIRALVKRIEVEEASSRAYSGVGGYTKSQSSANDKVARLARVNSDAGSVVPSNFRPFQGSTEPVADNGNSHFDEFAENGTLTPKANQYSKNVNNVSVKEKFSSLENNKKGNPRVGMKGELDLTRKRITMPDKLYKSCQNILMMLMKHRFGWVFNKPVDVEGLKLHDYYTIIKHPMDLGTVKSRLQKNWYKSPEDFAEDVRLTFSNAMVYNPKGQDVHYMAEALSNTFEEKWATIEAEFALDGGLEIEHCADLPTLPSRTAPDSPAPVTAPTIPTPALLDTRTLERSESMLVDSVSKASHVTSHQRETSVAKKQKADDPVNRDMTYEEKQRLRENLQSLPSEKLERVVEIIKERNPNLFQQDDEIELDLDSVGPETLWELDRFVAYCNRSISTNKRHNDLPLPAKQDMNWTAVNTEAQNETVERFSATSPVQVENRSDHVSGSSSDSGSSSSISSSDSGSSSSESERGSSSGYGSDAGQ